MFKVLVVTFSLILAGATLIQAAPIKPSAGMPPRPSLVSSDVRPLSPASLNALAPEARQAYLNKMRETQRQQGLQFEQQLFERNKAAFKDRLDKNPSLNANEKVAQLKKFEDEQKLRMAQREKQYKENQEFMDNMEKDKTLTPEQKRQKMQEFFKKQREQMPRALAPTPAPMARPNAPVPPRGRPERPIDKPATDALE